MRIIVNIDKGIIGDNMQRLDWNLRTINQLDVKSEVQVCEIRGDGPIRQRLLDMGILPQVMIRIERFALGGNTVWIETEGRHLALRKKEAMTIYVRESVSHTMANADLLSSKV